MTILAVGVYHSHQSQKAESNTTNAKYIEYPRFDYLVKLFHQRPLPLDEIHKVKFKNSTTIYYFAAQFNQRSLQLHYSMMASSAEIEKDDLLKLFAHLPTHSLCLLQQMVSPKKVISSIPTSQIKPKDDLVDNNNIPADIVPGLHYAAMLDQLSEATIKKTEKLSAESLSFVKQLKPQLTSPSHFFCRQFSKVLKRDKNESQQIASISARP